MKVVFWIFLLLIVLSSVDCLLFAWLNLDLVAKFFPDVVTTLADGTTSTAMSVGAKVVYSAFGVAGIMLLMSNLFGCKRCWKVK